MKIHLTKFVFYLMISIVLVGLTACGVDLQVPSEILQTLPPTAIISKESVTSTPILNSSFAPTYTAISYPTSTPGKSTPQPKPSPTALVLRNIPIEGGDPDNTFYAMLVYPNEPVFTTRLWFRVYAHKPLESKIDGEGIERVDFTILNSEGNEVYFRQEETGGYCAFGGGEPDCTILDFAESNYIWPDGGKIVSGTYTLNVLVTSKDQAFMFSDTPFTIKVP